MKLDNLGTFRGFCMAGSKLVTGRVIIICSIKNLVTEKVFKNSHYQMCL